LRSKRGRWVDPAIALEGARAERDLTGGVYDIYIQERRDARRNCTLGLPVCCVSVSARNVKSEGLRVCLSENILLFGLVLVCRWGGWVDVLILAGWRARCARNGV